MKKYFNNILYILVIDALNPVYAQTSEPLDTHALSFAAYHGKGDFGFDFDTQISYLPIRYEFNSGNWGFQLLAPMLEVDGPGSVLVNLGGVNRVFAGMEPRKESGLGDVVGSIVYRTNQATPNSPFVDFRVDIKFPTADDAKGLGSGEADLNIQVDLSQYLGQWLLFGSAGYSFRGDSALFPDLTDGAYAQLGAAFPVNESISAGFIYDYREAVASFTGDIHEVGPYVNWRIDSHWTLTGMTMRGLTGSSVDYSVLGQLRYSW